MTFSFVLLRLVIMPLLIGIVASGLTEAYKRNRIIPDPLKSKKAIYLVTALFSLLGSFVTMAIWKEQNILTWLLATFVVDYGCAVVIYTHLFKPIRERV